MPTSLDALTALDLTLIAAVAILSVVIGGLALRLQASPQASPPEDSQDLSDTLNALQEQLKAAQAETKDAREEAELTLLQLHQLQEELEHNFLDSRSKEELLQQYNQQTNDAREEAELTLLQLHQVQEELEHYFLDSRSKEELLQQYNQQANDMKKVISRISRSKT
ncbi:hypothetical protein WH7805_08346 [Synechococcus sp. WH 7805]|nr:hypothetical protein WH7805_08346 [Synechococcus sp. WH 7805]